MLGVYSSVTAEWVNAFWEIDSNYRYAVFNTIILDSGLKGFECTVSGGL